MELVHHQIPLSVKPGKKNAQVAAMRFSHCLVKHQGITGMQISRSMINSYINHHYW
jgi:hypothetical protein